MPTPQFSAPNITSLEELRDYVIKLQRDLQWLLTNLDDLNINRLNARVIESETITTDKIAAGAVTADKINVNELSAISANLGHITAGLIEAVQIFGSLIATSQSTFPRIEFASTQRLLKAMSDANNYVALSPSEGSAPAYLFYSGGVPQALFQFLSDFLLLITGVGKDMEITSGRDLFLFAGMGGKVKFLSWSEIYSLSNGQTLQSALDAKQNVINGASGTFTTADSKTVTVVNGIVTNIA